MVFLTTAEHPQNVQDRISSVKCVYGSISVTRSVGTIVSCKDQPSYSCKDSKTVLPIRKCQCQTATCFQRCFCPPRIYNCISCAQLVLLTLTGFSEPS